MFNVGDKVEVWNDGRFLQLGIIVDFRKGWNFPYKLRTENIGLEDYFCENELRAYGSEAELCLFALGSGIDLLP